MGNDIVQNQRIEQFKRKLMERLTPVLDQLEHEAKNSGVDRSEWLVAQEYTWIYFLALALRRYISEAVTSQHQRELSLEEQEIVFYKAEAYLHQAMADTLRSQSDRVGLPLSDPS